MKLAPLLKAKRADLLDGFPFKAAFKALSAKGSRSFKFDYLNSLLINENIELVLTKDESFLPGLENSGICDATINSDSSIEVKVTKAFFNVSGVSPFERALRFQSLVVHELVHRKQFERVNIFQIKDDHTLSQSDYVNDPLELEAMAAEIAHDTITIKYTASNLQPRYNEMAANAGRLTPLSLAQLRAHVSSFRQ